MGKSIELNTSKIESENVCAKPVELTEDELNEVTGGNITPQEKMERSIKKINEYFGFIPKEIRTKIISAYEKDGVLAARALAINVIKKNPTWAGILVLLD